MSISRGRYVATFCRPGCDISGKKCERHEPSKWIVYINTRNKFDIYYSGNTRDCRITSNFDEAKAWAVARLDELCRQDEEQGR